MGTIENSMDHKTRKIIYNYIFAHPGVAITHLSTILDLNYSTLKYHLKYLEKNNQIVSNKIGRNRCFYINKNKEMEEPHGISININSLNTNQQRVLGCIQDNSGITKKELIQLTRIKRKTIDYSLNKLMEMKLIWQVNGTEEGGYEYISEEKLRYEIINLLLMKLLSNEIDEETYRLIKKKLEGMDLEKLRSEGDGGT
jgi:predicted transcriptional regulator